MPHAMKYMAMALALGAAQSALATSAYFELSGNSCHVTQGGTAIPTRYGLYNPSPNYAVDVACPVQVPYALYTYGYIGISAYRRNPNDNLTCTLNMSNDDGTSMGSATASIPTTGSNRQYNSRYTYPPVPSEVVWVGCRIPAAYGGSYSYLNDILIQVSN